MKKRRSHKFTGPGKKVAAPVTKSKMRDAGTAIAKALKPVKAKIEANVDTQIAEQWKAGATIGQLAKEYSKKRSQIRRSITVAVGGKDEFRKLRSAGAGGTVQPFGGKRRTRSADGTPAPVIDDSKVPALKDYGTKDFEPEYRYKPVTVNVKDVGNIAWREALPTVYTLRHGKHAGSYVTATGAERADLIVVNPELTLGKARLRKFEGSNVAKKEKHEDALVERGEKALKATRARKRAAKQARIAAKSPSAKKRRAS